MTPALIMAAATVAGSLLGKQKEEKQEQISQLTPSQQRLQRQRERSVMGAGDPTAFGQVADFYRGNLSDDPRDFDAFAAPEMRRFREQTVPDLAEQFAGMGAGGLTSSGFRNAMVGAGADLSERLGALRANLRMQSAAGLQSLAEGAIQPGQQQSVIRPPAPGFLEAAAPGFAKAGASYMFDQMKSGFGETSPYGAKPQIQPASISNQQRQT
jgi:hypothetical protein